MRSAACAERRVFDDGVELVVDRDAERVEVGRADAHPPPVDDARLGVHHLALPLPDAHAVREQTAIVASRQQRYPRMVVAARQQDADVDAIARRAVQRLDLGGRRREVRRRDPDRTIAPKSPGSAARARRAGATARLRRCRRAPACRSPDRGARRAPGGEESDAIRGVPVPMARRHMWSNACIMSCAAGPSTLTAVSRQRERWSLCTPVVHSRPTPTPPGDADAAVDDEQLAVVARHEPEPRRECPAG